MNKNIVPSLFTIVGLFALSSCNSASTPVPLDVALKNVQNDLKKSTPISLGDIGSGGSVGLENFGVAVRQEQCLAREPNPIVPIFSAAFTLTLQGTFTQTGTFMVSALPVPTGGISYGVTQTKQQTLAVPITFVSLASLPLIYASQDLPYLTALPSGLNKAAGPKETEGARVSILKQQMETVVAAAIQSFNVATCPPSKNATLPIAVHPIVPLDNL